MSTCQEAVLIHKYVYSKPTYLRAVDQTFNNVCLKTPGPVPHREKTYSCPSATLQQQRQQLPIAIVNFTIKTYIHTYAHTHRYIDT